MNQILVTEKLYVTPELRRKKRIYKINFIVSIFIIVILCSFYAHSEYAKNREQDISQELLTGLIEQEEMTESEQEIANEQDNDVWKIMISSVQEEKTQEETKKVQENNTNKNPVTSSSNTQKKTTYITVKGKRYPSIGRIQIPKINVDLAILDQTTGDTLVAWLKISPCKFWGPDLNEIGNVSIAGHNYRNKRFFSKVPTLVLGDKIKITDISNRTVTYKIFDKYEVDPKDTSCINDIKGKENKRVITLITCTDDSKKRVILHAEEI